MIARASLPVALLVTLGGCAAIPAAAPPAVRPASATPALPIAGLENVIGADQRRLTAMFGAPRLDIAEGRAKKLQFTGSCVLDVYLYVAKGGGDPVATYVDARLPDGSDTDRARCVQALRKR